MYNVEIALSSGELSSQMAAMRMWLDEQRVESSKFTCRDSEGGIIVCIEFKIAREAERFAERFSDVKAAVRRPMRTLR